MAKESQLTHLSVKRIFHQYFTPLIPKRRQSNLQYWQQRAQKFGSRSVLNINHTEAEIEAVTIMQKSILFPLLKQHLKGQEKVILDFGCGTGRFTADLAMLIQGVAIGIDPVQHLLDLAPSTANVKYLLMNEGVIPLPDESVDAIWICLVLGGITDGHVVNTTITELKRVLTAGGLVFLVENTSKKQDGDYWKFRSVQDYQHLFNFVKLTYLSDYLDMNENISVMVGYK